MEFLTSKFIQLAFLSLAELFSARMANRRADRSFSGSVYDGFFRVPGLEESDTWMQKKERCEKLVFNIKQIYYRLGFEGFINMIFGISNSVL